MYSPSANHSWWTPREGGPGAVEKGDRARGFRHRDVEQLKAGGLQPGTRRLIGDRQDVANRLQRVRPHMGLRQVGPRDEFRRTRIADIDGGEVLRRAFVGEPQDATTVLGDLNLTRPRQCRRTHRAHDVRAAENSKSPSRSSAPPLIGADRSTRWPQPSRAALKCGLRWYPTHDVMSPPRKRGPESPNKPPEPAARGERNAIRGTVLSRR